MADALTAPSPSSLNIHTLPTQSIASDSSSAMAADNNKDKDRSPSRKRSISSLAETGSNFFGRDPYDFSCYMDQAPLTVQDNSPLELVQQFFTKLGARYVVVTDTDGHCA